MREDRLPQPITAFSRDMLPLSVVFLFDLSDRVQPILKLAEGACEMLGHRKLRDRVAIMVFSSQTELLQDFTLDGSLAAATIAKASDTESATGRFGRIGLLDVQKGSADMPIGVQLPHPLPAMTPPAETLPRTNVSRM